MILMIAYILVIVVWMVNYQDVVSKDNMSKKPFWENTYSKEGMPNTFNGGKPSLDVVEVLEKHVLKGNAVISHLGQNT